MVIVVLAFFIALIALGAEPESSLKLVGRESFVEYLQTFGLKRILPEEEEEEEGIKVIDRQEDPKYEDAQEALWELQRQFEVWAADDSPWKTVFVTPYLYGSERRPLTEEEQAMLERFANRIIPLLLRRGCVISVGALFMCPEEQEADAAKRSLDAVRELRAMVLSFVAPDLQSKASDRMYSFCRRVGSDERAAEPLGSHLRIDVLVTRIPEKSFEAKP